MTTTAASATRPAMTNESQTMSTPMHTDAAPTDDAMTFTTRFGEVTLRADRLITFPHGLFGFRECTQFGITKLPNVEGSPLMLMQCVNQPAFAFLVADPDALGVPRTESDRTEALDD
ncbi:MAG: flagellar assembly protein FliW, partial [Pseudomonadota bacterium]